MRESRTDGTHKNTISTSAIPNFTPSFNGSSSTTYNGISSLPQPLHVLTNTASPLPQSLHNNFGKPFAQPNADKIPLDARTNQWKLPATKPPLRFDSPQQSGFSFPPRPHPQAKHERTKEEVAELKAARRAEIERRCRLLNPPIEAGVLAHMASFQAAIQIIQPLTDSAWEVLKPRLLSQREEAEQRENDRIAQTRVQERFDERRFQDLQTKGDPKDLVDKEWEDIQAPLRARIGGYADEIIRDGWNNGEKVSPDTSPLFAAEVLIYVRKRFYAEIAKDEAAIRATGREPDVDPPNGPYTRRLTLENMKWVFDTKVKPHTEQYRKELFLCNACDHASKYYGFEGVIQHFAAKHTSALSSGSVVVHWKSEWPEYPPFNPDPAAASVSSYYPAAPGASAPYAVSNGQGVVPNYGYGGYQAAPLPAPMQTPNPHGYQESPGPYYGHPQFGDQYSGHQNGPYAPPPPQTYPDTSQAYHTPQYSLAPPNSNISGYHGILHDYSQQNFDGQYQSQSQSMYTSPHNRITYPATVPEASAQQAVYTHQAGQYSNNYIQPSSYAASNFPQVPQRSGEYTAQLLDLARNAREIWNSIGGLKEVPGSVKVYTIIYHILARFRSTYQDDPPFSMLVEGLSNNKDMRPVRNVNGLLCKACSLGMAGSSSAPQKKHFSFPQLVNHFHTLHYQELSQPNAGYLPDWKTDMVLLPDISKLTSIVHATGMDDKKLRFFTEALPEIVAAPEPSVHNYHNGSSHYLGGAPDSNEYSHLAPSQDNHEKYYTTADSGKPSETGSVTYDPGEYDPRHPAELPIVTQPQQKISRQREQQPDPSHNQASWQYSRHEDQAYRESYQDRLSRTYVEHSPARAIPVDDYGHALPEARRIYVDEPVRYREAGDIVEYRVRREPRIIEYQEPERMPSSYRLANDQSYRNNSAEVASGATSTYPLREQYARETNSTQQNRIYEVVAQISQQAQQARERVSAKLEAGGAGSEDGEVTAESASKPDLSRKPPSEEASNAAERFLNEFHPGEVANDPIPQETSNGSRRAWEADRPDSTHVHRPPMDSHLRGAREVYEENERVFNKDRRASPVIHDGMLNGYERAPPPLRDYAHNERYAGSAEGQPIHRDRSPELVDRRYKVNNVVYRDERQGSHGMHRTPSSRYARYESVRLENDRARSRSPQVYVKIGPHSGQYRERSPVAHPLRQESAYSTRTPLQHEEDAFERPRRQEYTRVYVEESRPRETRYAEEYELIRVSDPNGDYMIRRPVRREVEREPVYADYEDDVYARPPIYENRAPVARAEPAFVEEEYDPRQPGAVPVPVARYQ